MKTPKPLSSLKIDIMKKLILLITTAFICKQSCAQYSPDWVVASNDNQRYGTMTACDTSNNLIIVGYKPSFVGSGNIYTRKFNESGNLLWEQIDSSGVQGEYEMARWVNTDSDNNVYVSGFKYSGTSNIYTDNILAIKYNAAGQLLWKQTIPNYWLGGLPLRSALDDYGNLYIGTVGINPGFTLIKLDTGGNVLFNVSNASSNNISFASMRLKNNLIVMTSYAGNGGTVSVCAFDTSGAFLWSNMFTSRGGMDVEIDDSLNCYILTRELNQISATSNYDVEIFKFNSSGTLLNQFNYDFGNANDFANLMTLVNEKISIMGPSIQQGNAYMDWIIFQIDLNGNKLWDARYDFTTTNDEKPSWISAKSNGDVYVSGQGGPDTVSATGSHYLRYVTAKYSGGVLQWVDANPYQGYIGVANVLDKNCGLYVLGETAMTAIHYTDSCGIFTAISEININEELNHLQVYPNPFSSSTTIDFNLSESKNISILITDVTGRTVKTIPTKNLQSGKSKIELNLSELNSGIYFCQIKSIENNQTIKLIKN